MTINNSDDAYALVAGLEKAEQKLLLQAIINDMPKADFEAVLVEAGYEVTVDPEAE